MIKKKNYKNTQQTRNKVNYLSIIKTIYEKLLANIMLNCEKQKGFPLRSGTKAQIFHSHLFYPT